MVFYLAHLAFFVAINYYNYLIKGQWNVFEYIYKMNLLLNNVNS